MPRLPRVSSVVGRARAAFERLNEDVRLQVVIVAVVAALALGPGAVQQAVIVCKQRKMDHKLIALQRSHEQLLREHSRLMSNPVYVEGLMRSTFKVAKRDEFVVTIDPSDLNDR